VFAHTQDCINQEYEKVNLPTPRLTFIVVTKKSGTRIFTAADDNTRAHANPPVGTVVDNTITFPERYEITQMYRMNSKMVSALRLTEEAK